MLKNGIDHMRYPFLMCAPYPEPEYLNIWLREQFATHDHVPYTRWKGWIMFEQEHDAFLTSLTWHK